MPKNHFLTRKTTFLGTNSSFTQNSIQHENRTCMQGVGVGSQYPTRKLYLMFWIVDRLERYMGVYSFDFRR